MTGWVSKFQILQGSQAQPYKSLRAFGKWSATAFIQVHGVVTVVWIQIAGRYSLSENLDLCMSPVNELMYLLTTWREVERERRSPLGQSGCRSQPGWPSSKIPSSVGRQVPWGI